MVTVLGHSAATSGVPPMASQWPWKRPLAPVAGEHSPPCFSPRYGFCTCLETSAGFSLHHSAYFIFSSLHLPLLLSAFSFLQHSWVWKKFRGPWTAFFPSVFTSLLCLHCSLGNSQSMFLQVHSLPEALNPCSSSEIWLLNPPLLLGLSLIAPRGSPASSVHQTRGHQDRNRRAESNFT